MFDQGDGTCGECDINCGNCEGIPTNCTSCNSESEFPLLDLAACYPDCPFGFGNTRGVCEQCVAPCETCYNNTEICDSCDGSEGRVWKYGPNCFKDCPIGTILDLKLKACTGCTAGCKTCNDDTQMCVNCF